MSILSQVPADVIAPEPAFTVAQHAELDTAPLMALISLPRTRPAVASARHWLADTLTAWNVSDDQAYDAVVALSEVVTNAVVHAVGSGHSTVTAALWQGHLRVTVSDPDPELHGAARSDEHGRGLLVVKELALRCGADRLAGGGKLIWFEQLVTVTDARGCLECGHEAGCDCDCCRYPLPAVAAAQLVGGAR